MNKNRYFKILLILMGSFLVVILLLYGLLVGGIYWGVHNIPIQDLNTIQLESDKLELKKNPSFETQSQDKSGEQGSQQTKKSKLSIEQGRLLFLEVDKINQLMAQAGAPSICELICQESFSKRHKISLKRDGFIKYFNEYPEEFIHDPRSRLGLLNLSNYRKFFNLEFYDFINQVERFQKMEYTGSEFEKLSRANSIVFNFLDFVKKKKSDFELNKKEYQIVKKLIELNKSCEAKKISEVQSECESLIQLK